MDLVSLSTLRTLSRQRADLENSQFISDTELLRYLNRAYAELYDLIVTEANSDDYFLKSSDISLVSGTKAYDLPTDFYKSRGVDLTVGSDIYPLRRYNFSQRDVGSRYSLMRNLRYHIQGNSIYITPKPSSSNTITIWYVPSPRKFDEQTPTGGGNTTPTTWTVPSTHTFQAGDYITGLNFLPVTYNVDQTVSSVTGTTVVTDLDSSGLGAVTSYGSIESRFDFFSAWDDFLICTAAIDCLVKEESDTTALMMMKEQSRGRIIAVANMRDLGEPVRVTDISSYYSTPAVVTWY